MKELSPKDSEHGEKNIQGTTPNIQENFEVIPSNGVMFSSISNFNVQDLIKALK